MSADSTYHMDRQAYKEFKEYYINAKPASVHTIGNRISRIYDIMHSSMHLKKYTTGDGYFNLTKITESDFMRLIMLLNARSVESKKQISLTLQLLAKIYKCQELLHAPSIAEYMQFIIDEANKERSRPVAVDLTWTNIINRAVDIANTIGQTTYNTEVLFAILLIYAPPLRHSEYLSIRIYGAPNTGNYLNADTGLLTIRDHKSVAQFNTMYHKDGIREISMAPEIMAYIRKVHNKSHTLFYGPTNKKVSAGAFYKMIEKLFGIGLNKIRAIYLRDIVKPMTNKSTRLGTLYVMGKISM